MEYYLIKAKWGNKREMGIAYSPQSGVCFVGGYTKDLEHITNIAFKHMRFTEKELLPKSGVRQKNRYRYYCPISDLDFRKGLYRLRNRYGLFKLPRNIQKYT